jgi:NADH:ubiquinone reductase (H+-translocating)
LGGGFAGLGAAKALGEAAVDIALIDRDNHLNFRAVLNWPATALIAPDGADQQGTGPR